MFENEDMAALRAAVAAYHAQSLPPKPQQPDAPGCEKLSDAGREVARTMYAESIMAKSAGQLTADERRFLKAGIAAWVADQQR